MSSVIIIKLQKRVKADTATLLIKVKDHRGDPLNEETDIRTEMGRLKEDNEKTWSTQTDRTIYHWSEPSMTLERDSYYQNVSMDPDCSESNATESRRNTSF